MFLRAEGATTPHTQGRTAKPVLTGWSKVQQHCQTRVAIQIMIRWHKGRVGYVKHVTHIGQV